MFIPLLIIIKKLFEYKYVTIHMQYECFQREREREEGEKGREISF